MTTRILSRVRMVGMLVALLMAWQGAQAQQPVNTAQAAPSVQSALQVNINEADAETIADVLVGVGLTRAQAIVQYRDEHGPFESVDDLIEVKGIGEATLRSNRERIRLE